MKKVILICAFFILNFSNSFSQWQYQIVAVNYFTSLSFINNQTGYVYAINGEVYKTTNMGVNWNNIGICNVPGNPVLKGYANSDLWYYLYFDSNNATSSNKLKKSSDFSNWQTITFPSVSLRDVKIINGKGYCLGNINNGLGDSSGVLYYSSNNGNNWNILYQKPNTKFFDFYIKSEMEIGILEKSSIHKTTNGGANWIIQNVSGTTNLMIPVSLSNPFENIILIACARKDALQFSPEYGRILRSSNEGNNWDSVFSTNTSAFSEVYFNNLSMVGYVIGSNGKIFKSINAGLTWGRQSVFTSSNLTDLYPFNKDTIFICTSAADIVKTMNGGGPIISIQQIGSSIPDKFNLQQNYPNPFNPNTKIKFEIPSSEFTNVKLIIYDITGKEIAKLINQNLSPGVYEVDFNGQNLSSGVYYYKLITGNYNEVKKMMLIK